jgi:hypothetical protein
MSNGKYGVWVKLLGELAYTIFVATVVLTSPNSPGRFFVSYVMKHVFWYILENYEPSMMDAQGKKTFGWRTLTIPRPGVEIVLGSRT